MERFKKICKKPLAIGSICVIVAFLLGLIIMGASSYTEATYKYSLKDIITIEIEVEDDEVTITTTSLGSVSVEEYDAMIKHGKLYIKENPTDTNYTELGKIDAYKLVLQELVDESDPSQGYVYTTFKCGLANTMRTINIVMIVIGSLGLAGSVIYMLYDKNKTKSSTATNTPAETSNENV